MSNQLLWAIGVGILISGDVGQPKNSEFAGAGEDGGAVTILEAGRRSNLSVVVPGRICKRPDRLIQVHPAPTPHDGGQFVKCIS